MFFQCVKIQFFLEDESKSTLHWFTEIKYLTSESLKKKLVHNLYTLTLLDRKKRGNYTPY